MSADSDSGLLKSFIKVLGGLVVFTVCIMFLATIVAPPADYSGDAMLAESKQKRIAPVGQLRTAESVEAAGGTVEVLAATPKTAQELYDGVCAACHATGVAGAPKHDDTAEWEKRGAVGVDALVASAIAGKGGMPPKGGSSYSDEEMKSVVELLLGMDAAPAEDAAPAATEEAPATEAAAEEAPATEAAAEEAPAAEVVAAGGEISDVVKNAVDTVCSACHIAGVGGAPKFGDKADWDARVAAEGLDGMLAVSISGRGAMPPRGTSQLTDEELAQAIQYMMSK